VYTSQKTPLAKLRAYHKELTDLYLEALGRRDEPTARRIYELRRRVWRAVLIREEWGESVLPESAPAAA